MLRFMNLEVLWLNDNKLSKLKGLEHNFRLKQLYLHNNRLATITNASCCLPKLHHLELLQLENNLLQDLKATLKVLQGLLTHLYLAGNPLANEHNYRASIIYALPQLELLDSSIVTTAEREAAVKLYEAKKIEKKMAFGSVVVPWDKPPVPPKGSRSACEQHLASHVAATHVRRRQEEREREAAGAARGVAPPLRGAPLHAADGGGAAAGARDALSVHRQGTDAATQRPRERVQTHARRARRRDARGGGPPGGGPHRPRRYAHPRAPEAHARRPRRRCAVARRSARRRPSVPHRPPPRPLRASIRTHPAAAGDGSRGGDGDAPRTDRGGERRPPRQRPTCSARTGDPAPRFATEPRRRPPFRRQDRSSQPRRRGARRPRRPRASTSARAARRSARTNAATDEDAHRNRARRGARRQTRRRGSRALRGGGGDGGASGARRRTPLADGRCRPSASAAHVATDEDARLLLDANREQPRARSAGGLREVPPGVDEPRGVVAAARLVALARARDVRVEAVRGGDGGVHRAGVATPPPPPSVLTRYVIDSIIGPSRSSSPTLVQGAADPLGLGGGMNLAYTPRKELPVQPKDAFTIHRGPTSDRCRRWPARAARARVAWTPSARHRVRLGGLRVPVGPACATCHHAIRNSSLDRW